MPGRSTSRGHASVFSSGVSLTGVAVGAAMAGVFIAPDGPASAFAAGAAAYAVTLLVVLGSGHRLVLPNKLAQPEQ